MTASKPTPVAPPVGMIFARPCRRGRPTRRRQMPELSPCTYAHRSPGRPQAAGTVRTLVLDMARDNPGPGSRRTHSELVGLGHKLAPPTASEILKGASTHPAPRRSGHS